MDAFPMSVAIERYKAACEAAVDSIGTRIAVAALLGISPSLLTRALDPNRPDVTLTGPTAMRLEKLSKRSFLAEAFASLSGCHVVSDDEGPAGGEEDVVDHIVAMSKEHSEAIGAVADFRARPSPASARAAIKEIGEDIQSKQAARAALAVIAGRRRAS